MTPSFSLTMPRQILFGRGEAQRAPELIRSFGTRGLLVHGASAQRAEWLMSALGHPAAIACPSEPDLPMLEAALETARQARPDWVVALGGGAALDLGKALAALIPQPGTPMDHLEVVGRGLPLTHTPLPFVAIPTTAGTGAEVTKNAVIGIPEHSRKVSLRDDRMMARLAIVDPSLTDGCPWPVTLASGLDAVTQVIEPYVSCRANPVTDALCQPAIARGLRALMRLEQSEDPESRTDLALVSLTGGIALANAGLGAVHGLAGVIGGETGAAHGAICGALLAPILAANSAAQPGNQKLKELRAILGEVFGTSPEAAPSALDQWARNAGLPGLQVAPERRTAVAEAAQASSSMKGNPGTLSVAALVSAMEAAA